MSGWTVNTGSMGLSAVLPTIDLILGVQINEKVFSTFTNAQHQAQVLPGWKIISICLSLFLHLWILGLNFLSKMCPNLSLAWKIDQWLTPPFLSSFHWMTPQFEELPPSERPLVLSRCPSNPVTFKVESIPRAFTPDLPDVYWPEKMIVTDQQHWCGLDWTRRKR